MSEKKYRFFDDNWNKKVEKMAKKKAEDNSIIKPLTNDEWLDREEAKRQARHAYANRFIRVKAQYNEDDEVV